MYLKLMLTVPAALIFVLAVQGKNEYENGADARDYLIKFGYLAPPDPFTGSLVSYEDFKKSIIDFQLMAGLEPTGEITPDTLKMMNRERCGVSDKLGSDRYSARKKRFNLQGSKWYKNTLTYSITTYTSQLSKEDVDRTMKQAFMIWSKHANLTIMESTSSTTADILIYFTNGSHEDSFPFDGKGGVLAHAFFPERGGDTHFDDQEKWILGDADMPGGVDLLFAAVHEFGHSLGLGHSDAMDSIMAPIYRGYVPNLDLKDDDIRAIQSLYGKKLSSPPGSQSNAEYDREPVLTADSIDLCRDSKIDGITTTKDGNTYIFKGIFYWKLRTEGRLSLDPRYPQRIQNDWPGLRGNIDTVYTDFQGRTFFFQGDRYWEFENQVCVVTSGEISQRFPGLPANLDVIFTWTGNGKTYAFKGGDYYRILDDGSVAYGYPRDVTIWSGLPLGQLDAAINFKNSRTYFFAGQDYYRYNDRFMNVDADYPLPTAGRWFGCLSNIVSNEGQYNKQWLEVEEDKIITQTYPPDFTLPPLDDPSSGAAMLLPSIEPILTLSIIQLMHHIHCG